MKKLLSMTVLSCWIGIAVLGFVGLPGCGDGGVPAPPEDVQDPDDEETEEWLEGERAPR